LEPPNEKKQDDRDDKKEATVTKPRFTWEDIKFIIVMTIVTIGFSLRGGEMPGALWATLRQIFVSVFYGFGTVFLFIGLTKKMFKYNPTRVHIVKWAFALAAIFSVSQFFHEGYLMFTGQLPPPPPK